jgi:hypothetical protein
VVYTVSPGVELRVTGLTGLVLSQGRPAWLGLYSQDYKGRGCHAAFFFLFCVTALSSISHMHFTCFKCTIQLSLVCLQSCHLTITIIIPEHLFFLWDLSLNSECRACKAGTLPLESHLLSILFWLFWRWGGDFLKYLCCSNCNPPDLSLRSYDYRCEPPAPRMTSRTFSCPPQRTPVPLAVSPPFPSLSLWQPFLCCLWVWLL